LSEVSHTKTKRSDVDSLIKTEPNPAGYLCLDKEEVAAVADFKIGCEVNKLDLNLMSEQYRKCQSANACAPIVLPVSKTLYWASVITAGVLGFIAGAAR
jgi:hypothetical protein